MRRVVLRPFSFYSRVRDARWTAQLGSRRTTVLGPTGESAVLSIFNETKLDGDELSEITGDEKPFYFVRFHRRVSVGPRESRFRVLIRVALKTLEPTR